MTWKNWFCFVLFCFVFLQNFNSLSGIISILQGIRFIKQNGLSSSFSSQSPKPHLLADSCNIPITAFPVFMFSSWSRKYDRFCIFPNISPQMLVNPLAFKGPQNLSFCWQQEYRLFFFHSYVDVIYWHCCLSKMTVIFHIILNRQTFVSQIWTKLMKKKIIHWVQVPAFFFVMEMVNTFRSEEVLSEISP